MKKFFKKLLWNNKWVGISEVIAASTIFIIIYTSILSVLSVNDSSFLIKQRESAMASTYSEIYGYLYSYKKNYWTSMFKSNFIWSTTCNWTVNSSDANAGQWCTYYPYYNAWDIVFTGSTVTTSAASNWSQTYFSTPPVNAKSYVSTNKLPGNKQVIVFIRQDASDEDTFYVKFRIVDTTDKNLVPSKIYVNFDQTFQIY